MKWFCVRLTLCYDGRIHRKRNQKSRLLQECESVVGLFERRRSQHRQDLGSDEGHYNKDNHQVRRDDPWRVHAVSPIDLCVIVYMPFHTVWISLQIVWSNQTAGASIAAMSCSASTLCLMTVCDPGCWRSISLQGQLCGGLTGLWWVAVYPLSCACAVTTRPFAQWNPIPHTCNIPKHWKSTKTRSYLN